MSDKKPKKFTIVRAKSDIDESKLRDEKISDVLDEYSVRDYKFSLGSKLACEYPVIMVMPNSEIDDYWRTMIESVSTLSGDTSLIVKEDAPTDTMQQDLMNQLCNIGKLMDYIVNTDSWKNNELSELDKETINSMIEKLKL